MAIWRERIPGQGTRHCHGHSAWDGVEWGKRGAGGKGQRGGGATSRRASDASLTIPASTLNEPTSHWSAGQSIMWSEFSLIQATPAAVLRTDCWGGEMEAGRPFRRLIKWPCKKRWWLGPGWQQGNWEELVEFWLHFEGQANRILQRSEYEVQRKSFSFRKAHERMKWPLTEVGKNHGRDRIRGGQVHIKWEQKCVDNLCVFPRFPHLFFFLSKLVAKLCNS